MTEYDVIIIGAGPAGLFCAINCAGKNGLRTLILEKNSSAGRKLLLSGSGQCNLTHSGDTGEFLTHYGPAKKFLRPALMNFSSQDTVNFFSSRGLPLTEREDGKIFPQSMKAPDVLRLLLDQCAQKGVVIKYNEAVQRAAYSEGRFTAASENEEYTSPFLVIAAGGRSYPSTGSTGDGYTLASSLGHTIADPAPALTPVYIDDPELHGLAGITFSNSVLQIYRNSEKVSGSRGDILVTHKGLSGPAVLDSSRYIRPGDSICISLTEKSPEEINSMFIEASRKEGKKGIRGFLSRSLVPEKAADFILRKTGTDPAGKMSEISRERRRALTENLTSAKFTVDRTGDFKTAMATAGGVPLKEISPKTMESKIVKGLYFAGEVADIDGDTGGYNIQAALSTGILAAQGIIKSHAR